MSTVRAALPALRTGCRLSIAIPAKNEAASIANALGAFARQCALDGSALDPRLFEVLILANDCDDDTADVARRFAARHPHIATHVVTCTLPRDAAHIGSARRMALDLATVRQSTAHGHAGIIASTDADSCVDRYWVVQTLREMADVDVVAGHVEIARAEREAMAAPLRLLYDRERRYRRLLGELEARYDPRAYDPPKRHDSFVGASFAIRASTYIEAGRLPVLPRLEDVAFAFALRRIDARIRHSYDVCVETSARSEARVEGGFGSFVDGLRERGSRRETFLVDNATRSVLRAKTRGLLRAYWAAPTCTRPLDEAAALYRITTRELFGHVDPLLPFGETLERIDAIHVPFEALPDESVDAAIAVLCDAISAAEIAPAATRISAASGAG